MYFKTQNVVVFCAPYNLDAHTFVIYFGISFIQTSIMEEKDVMLNVLSFACFVTLCSLKTSSHPITPYQNSKIILHKTGYINSFMASL